jgi:uncharacterized surface protein with fasciclin (FAS1) repeats
MKSVSRIFTARHLAALSAALVLATAAIGVSSTAQAGHHSGGKGHDSKDIVDTAAAAGTFETLLAAAQAAGLVDALKGAGPLTVFAPTDEAFAKLPEGTVENLLKPENKDALAGILLYHVVAGKIMSGDIGASASPATLQGATIDVKASYGKVTVNGATVVAADVGASNGVIHVIDTVILPPST